MKAKRPTLSICVPTFNRGKYIGQTLQSLIEHTDSSVEIVVSDNASQDETSEIVAQHSRTRPIVYHRFDENVGADRNFLKAVSLAKGDYCWLFGSDDLLLSNLDSVFEVIEGQPGITGISLPALSCNLEMTQCISLIGGSFEHREEVTRFESVEETFLNIGEYFGFLTGHIFRRSAWVDASRQFDPSPFFNAYVHVYLFGRALQQSPGWCYLDKTLIAYRNGNDSFLADGRIRRMEIDMNGYRRIAEALFGAHSPTTHRFIRKICRIHIYSWIWQLHQNMPRREFHAVLPKVFRAYYRYPEFYTRILPFFIVPLPVFLGLRKIRRRLRKSRYPSPLDPTTSTS